MFAIPWYAVIFISIPETLSIIGIGFALFNINIALGRSIGAGISVGVVSYFLRLMLIPPGIHIIILTLLLTVAISCFCQIKLCSSFVAVLLGAMILGVIENVITSLALNLTAKTVNDLAANPWLNIEVFLPTLLLASLLYLLIRRLSFVLYDLNMR